MQSCITRSLRKTGCFNDDEGIISVSQAGKRLRIRVNSIYFMNERTTEDIFCCSLFHIFPYLL